jgi:nucleotide-binding universal stress UspA family protein
MFQHILVPVDGTPRSEESLSIALELAMESHARVVLLRVEPEHVSASDVTADHEVMQRAVERLRAAGIDSYAIMEYDQPAEGISRAARSQRSDLIIMAPRHRGPLDGLLHPSVTAKMLSRAPAPVFIWPDQISGEEPLHFLRTIDSLVIVPLDGSELAEHALPTAVEMAREYDRTLLLARVVPPVVLVDSGAETVRLAAHAQHEAEDEALHYLRRIRRHVAREYGVPIQTTLLVGDPADRLTQFVAAHPNSVIVMTTHGRTGLTKLLVGSVASSIIQHTTAPVVIVPYHHEDVAIYNAQDREDTTGPANR